MVFSPAFTLIELLVVIAIIAILIIILWAAVRNAIADAKIKTAKAEMHEIVSAVTAYFHEYEKLPVPSAAQGQGNEWSLAYSGAAATPIYQMLTGQNPRGRVFLSREFSSTNVFMVDPWSTSYILYFDLDYSGSTSFKKLATAPNAPTPATDSRSGRVVVQSYGPNRSADDVSYSTCDDILVNE